MYALHDGGTMEIGDKVYSPSRRFCLLYTDLGLEILDTDVSARMSTPITFVVEFIIALITVTNTATFVLQVRCKGGCVLYS